MDERFSKRASEFSGEESKEIAEFLLNYRDRAYEELHQQDEWFTKFIFHTNGAGAIALLGYIGALIKPGSEISWEIPLALMFFALGIVLSGVSAFCSLRSFSHIHDSLCDLLVKWHNDEIMLRDISSPKLRTKFSYAAKYSNYTAFIFFILGTVLALIPSIIRSAF